jgi:mono/diheme cytochrome c family protein
MLIKSNARRKKFVLANFFLLLFVVSGSSANVNNAFDSPVDHPDIPLLDEQGVNVLESRKPYSPKKSCEGSGCHDYEAITKAYHFEMGRDEADDDYGAKRGLPHLVSPGYYGGYTCMGGSNPMVLSKKDNIFESEFADAGSAGWVKACMSCHIGGGWAEKDRNGIRYDEKDPAKIKPLDGDYYEWLVDEATGEERLGLWDWKKSGVGEADCLFCHIDFSTRKLPADSHLNEMPDPRQSRQNFVRAGFFRQAATGFLETVVNKNNQNLVTVVRDEEGALVLDENGMPQFNWHAEAFDETGRVTIPMLRFPANDNCMACHRTSNSRRGFYGFGDDAAATQDPVTGVLEADYKDDVHKGKRYIDDNGQERVIDNCNACHAKQYFKSPLAAIDLDANHDFPKGNSDMDVRNDLDFSPNVKSCETCHITSVNPVVPSGHNNLLDAHRELWKANGDMAGYSERSLNKITLTHYQVVACQTCHIVDKKGRRGAPLQLLYRYREAEDGSLKITPYNPRFRYRWVDKVSGHVLSRKERNAIFDKGQDENGNFFGNIVDRLTGEVLGQVSASNGRHGFRFGDPDTYESVIAVKRAYDSLLKTKGYAAPDTAMVWSESNEYLVSHNTRPSPDSMPCGDCHARKQSGAFSALLSPDGVLGVANEKLVTTLPDARLVEEGIVVLELPYMKVKPDGSVVENVSDILYATKVDPFMTLLKNSSANEVIGKFVPTQTTEVLAALGVEANRLAGDLNTVTTFVLKTGPVGKAELRKMMVATEASTVNSLLLPTYSAKLWAVPGVDHLAQEILDANNYGKLRSSVFNLTVLDSAKQPVPQLFDAPLIVKAAYKGTKSTPEAINVVMGRDGVIWQVAPGDIMSVQPANAEGEAGYVVFRTSDTGLFVVTDKM